MITIYHLLCKSSVFHLYIIAVEETKFILATA
nr:MAG TPA: hypothetical protein [Caudoviricetes sp.]